MFPCGRIRLLAPVPGCAGRILDLRQPALLGSAVADAQGVARDSAFVPASMSGK